MLHGASKLVPLSFLRGRSLFFLVNLDLSTEVACFGIKNTNRSYGASETSVAVRDRQLTVHDAKQTTGVQKWLLRHANKKKYKLLNQQFSLNEPTKDVTVMMTTGCSWLLNFFHNG